MGILSRFSTIMKANVNAKLDEMEDPSKMVDQTLLDLRKDLASVKSETAEVMANEQSAKRAVENCEKQADKIHQAAMNAVKAGNDDDARKLLAQEQDQRETLASLQDNLAAASENSVKMREMYNKLTDDIQKLETRKSAVKAKTATAKAKEHINNATSKMSDGSASMAAFERMEKKADAMLDRAEANAQLDADLSCDSDLVKRYASGPASVEDDLAALKAELGMIPKEDSAEG